MKKIQFLGQKYEKLLICWRKITNSLAKNNKFLDKINQKLLSFFLPNIRQIMKFVCQKNKIKIEESFSQIVKSNSILSFN